MLHKYDKTAIGRSENTGGAHSNVLVIICPLVKIGLTDKNWGVGMCIPPLATAM